MADAADDTIYIMKDFASLDLAANASSSSSGAGQLSRLAWGPAWRFDHTLVVAPTVDSSANAAVLYGGASGVEIFGDLWLFGSAPPAEPAAPSAALRESLPVS